MVILTFLLAMLKLLACFLLVSLPLFYGFVFYAGCVQAWPRMKIGHKILVSPVLLVFGLADVGFNATFGTLLYLEWPRWSLITFSKRCEYHMNDTDWRGSVAGAYCFMLNTFIPDHCQKK